MRLYAFRFPVKRVNVVIIFFKIRLKTSMILRNADQNELNTKYQQLV